MRLGIAHRRESAVLRDVEPLVTVRRPAVRQLQAVHQCGIACTGAREQAERAIDMHPRVVRVRERHQRAKVVEGGRVEVRRIQPYNRRTTARNERRFEHCWRHGTEGIRRQRHQLLRANASIAQGAVERDVPHGTDQHTNGWRTGEPLCANIPSGSAQHVIARRQHTDKVRHLASRRKRERCTGRQTEHVEQPLARHFFHHGRRGRRCVDRRILIPRRKQPLGRHGRR